MAKLVISGPDGKESEYELVSKETRIGRVAPMVDLVVNDGRASRLHAVIRKLQNGFTVVDLNSANGTYVNEKPIKELLLREGDVVRIGETRFRFEASRAAPQVEQVDQPIPKGGTVMLVQSDSFKVARSDKLATPDEIARLRKKAEILSHMFDLSKTLSSVFNMEEIYGHVADMLFELTPAARVVFFEIAAGTDELIATFATFRDKSTAVRKESVTVSRTILRQAVDDRVALLVSDALNEFKGAKSVVFQNISSAICAPMVGQSGVLGAIYADANSRNPLDVFTEDNLELMNAVASQVSVAVESAITHKQLSRAALARAAYQRFLPAHVVEQIVESPDSLKLGGVTQEITVLFADVVGFTTMSSKSHPEQVVEMLNRLFSVLTEIVFRHGGTLDKYIGDAIMALFGAPYVDERDADNAVQCALEMRDALVEINEDFAEIGFPRVNLSIGLNTGPATVGYIGSERRTDYTAIGDTVNLAARLQSAAKPGQVLISDKTVQSVGDDFEVEPIGELKLKGYDREIGAYSVIRANVPENTNDETAVG
jgi:adenylate cyclase